MAPKRRLIEGAPVQKPPKKLPKSYPTVDKAVAKKLKDNMKGWSQDDLTLTKVHWGDGVGPVSAKEKVAADYKRQFDGDTTVVMGSMYWSSMRDAYRSPKSAHVALEPEDPELPVDPRLFKAIIACKRQNPDREQLKGYPDEWLATGKVQNATEVPGIFRQMISLKMTCAKQRPLALELLRWIAREKINVKYAGEFGLVFQWVDDAVCVIWARAQKDGLNRGDFLSVHEDVVELALMNEQDDWANVSEHLVQATNTSQTALGLFGFALTHVVSSRIVQILAEQMTATFTKSDTLGDAWINSGKSVTMRQIESLAGLENLSRKRTVNLAYRGGELPIEVESWQDEVSHAFECARRELGVENDDLAQYSFEHLIAPAGFHSKLKGKPSAKSLAPARAARKALVKAFKDEGATSGDQMKAVAEGMAEGLVLTDPFYKIELAIILKATSATQAGGRVQEELLGCLASKDANVLPEEAVQSVSCLKNTDTYKMACSDAQDKVESVLRWLGKIVEEQPPNLRDAQKDDFLGPVVSQLGYFVRWGPSAGASTAVFKYGMDAMREKIDLAKGKLQLGTVAPEDVVQIRTFPWLIPKPLRNEARAIIKDVDESSGAIVPVAYATPAKVAKKAAEGKKAEKDTATDAALALFGKKKGKGK
ncbi:unnamed protein product [Prorocentrum cordatum]|uniref:Uncharacterized protein n=1 Tax=Prorocentrum cordatum TaxID=2364126 RepID=A0ABN9Q3X3_9DINO|nr:unnamed protein product [Polarella glacialis]